MNWKIPTLAIIAAAAGYQAWSASTVKASTTKLEGAPRVVQLFTSEGCSSCPSADAFVAELAKNPNVIVLSHHVDYWNQLGWEDPFSKVEFSQLQYRYASVFQTRSVYTPQIVVNGKEEMVGSDRGSVYRALEKPFNPSVLVTLNQTPAGLTYKLSAAPKDAKVFIAVTEDNITVSVKSGENGGRTLNHSGVVRTWKELPPIQSGSVKIDKISPHQKAVLLVQNSRTLEILGAAQIQLSAR